MLDRYDEVHHACGFNNPDMHHHEFNGYGYGSVLEVTGQLGL
ncbi:UNVERIFIED_ORG: hypothetical protein ABIC43_004282 [Variovorax guangxiensis]